MGLGRPCAKAAPADEKKQAAIASSLPEWNTDITRFSII